MHYYWLGMYKITAARSARFYWYATSWYDLSTSAFRHWAYRYPRHRYDTCVGYTTGGMIDMPCSDKSYFTCKKEAGTTWSPNRLNFVTFCPIAIVILHYRLL